MKTVYGVGINDSDYVTRYCPFYARWRTLLNRVYAGDNNKRNVKYKGVTVCDEWLTFSAFRSWVETQDYEGKQLDKDIITPGNKIYSPGNCCFVDSQLNQLFAVDHSSNTGLPIGVKDKQNRPGYESYIRDNGKRIYLGYHKTARSAHLAWQKAKLKIIDNYLDQNPNLADNVYRGVMLRKLKLENAILNKLEITEL